jgi:Zn-dependent protease
VSLQTELEIAQYGILFGSIILHEVSHGWSALALGDDTAKKAGRLSLNPLVHIDPIGTVVLPALLIIAGAPVFGWAKPVPVNVSRLRHPRNGAVLTALAGPAMNLVLVGIAWLLLRILQPETFWPLQLLFFLGLINLWLAIFNLLPLPPLDGSSVVERFLPERWYGAYLSIRPYTLVVVIAFVFLGQHLLTSGFNAIANFWQNIIGYG